MRGRRTGEAAGSSTRTCSTTGARPAPPASRALYDGGRGTPVKPLNDSKGCGGVMRVAPDRARRPSTASTTAARAAALTHGHPSGYLSSGAFADVVGELLGGAALPDAIASARVELAQWPDHDETMRSIDAAVALAASGHVDAERIETLGGGWVGEEALAIGLCCALVAPDVRTRPRARGQPQRRQRQHRLDRRQPPRRDPRRRRAARRPARPARGSRRHRDRGRAISPTCSSTGVRSTAPATHLAEHARRDAAVKDRPLARTGFSWYR